jgi:hypothetical protein
MTTFVEANDAGGHENACVRGGTKMTYWVTRASPSNLVRIGNALRASQPQGCCLIAPARFAAIKKVL